MAHRLPSTPPSAGDRARRGGAMRPGAMLAGLAMVIIASYGALAGTALWREHAHTTQQAERTVRAMARLVAGLLTQTVDSAERELDLMDFALAHHSRLPPHFSTVAVLDTAGTLRSGDADLAARLPSPVRPGVTAGPPLPDGAPTLLLTHAAPQGGHVAALMPVSALTRLLEAADLPGLDGVEIALADGTLLRPAPEVDAGPRLTVAQAAGDSGLQVVLSQPWSAILADWHATLREAVLIGALVATGVLMLTVALVLWMRRTQAAEEARRAAEAASAAKSDFLALMSHELRTPLNTVLGFAEMIRDRAWGPGAEDRYVEYAGDIHAAGTHLLSVLNDVLDLAKIEAGHMVLRPEPLCPAALAQACHRLSSGQARASGVSIDTEVAEDTGPLYADPRAVRQMVVNLLSNACKFTPPGGMVRLRICDAPQGGTLVTVTDTGVGMTPEGIEKAMQRFGQVDNLLTRAQTGTGLGLPLVKALVELHRGRLEVDSAPGCGTRVTLAFPPPPLAVTAKAAVRVTCG